MREDGHSATRGWRCFGRVLGVRAPRAVLDPLEGLIPPSAWRPTTAAPERLWQIGRYGSSFSGSVDGRPFGSWEDPEEAARALRGDMEIWVGANARGFVLVHASALAVDDRALLVPGPSMSGKSTLAAALVEAGADYLSDEYAVLDSGGLVHPYPRPLCIRGEQGARRHLSGEYIGRRQFGVEGLRVGLLSALPFVEAVESLHIREISRAEAVLVLFANSVAARIQPETVLEAAVATVAHARCFSGVRGQANRSAGELLELLASPRSLLTRPLATRGGDWIRTDDPMPAESGR